MVHLMLLRHAKSDWSSPGVPDHDRPLNQRGVQAAKLMGKVIEKSLPRVELVVASTAVRVQETLRLMQDTWKRLSPSISSTRELYLASPKSILQMTERLDNSYSAVLVIAHNPGLEELAQQLSGQAVAFPTACVAEFRTSADSWALAAAPGAWAMQQVLRPRDLE